MNKIQKRQRVDLSILKKLEIIEYVENLEGNNQKIIYKEISEKFHIKPTTLSGLLKPENRQKVKKFMHSDGLSSSIKRVNYSQFELTNKALYKWFAAMRNSRPDISINTEMLRIKANELSKDLNEINDGQVIDINWVNRWKKQYDISSKKLCGESGAVSEDVLHTWKDKTVSYILSKYQPDNILNCDEFGLFWKITPDRTLAFKSDKVFGHKKSKDRITVLLTASMSGQKYTIWVIGKFSKPRCFKGVRKLPANYNSNRKAWMTTEIFTEYLKKLDSDMIKQKRKIALILDRCTAHPNLNTLKNVELFFLPPNTTSKSQPLDAGIIHSIKCFYRKNLLNKVLCCYENDIDFNFNLIDALYLLTKSWEAVTISTIVNCFGHVGFLSNLSNQNLQEDKEAVEDIYSHEKLKNILNYSGEFEDFVKIDESIPTTYEINNSSIISILKETTVDKENSDVDAEQMLEKKVPSNKEVLIALKTIKEYLYSNESIKEDHLKNFNDLLVDVDMVILKQQKQSKITCYFNKC